MRNNKSRLDNEANGLAIRNAYVDFIKEHKRKPTLKEVSERTGLSSNTVAKHLAGLSFEPTKHPLRVLTDDVLLAIQRSAERGNPASQKLWLQVMEGWKEANEASVSLDGHVIVLPPKPAA